MEPEKFINIPAGYESAFNDGVYSVMQPTFKFRLEKFLADFRTMQDKENYTSLPVNLIPSFPFVKFPPLKNEIYSRRQDLVFMTDIFNAHPEIKTILEVGGWNGWMTSWMFSKNKNVVTTDIFADEINGLGTKKFHTDPGWLSVQADITDISIFKQKFDLVIFNHCLQFLPDPVSLTAQYKQLLSKNGLMVLAGVSFHSFQQEQKLKRSRYNAYFADKYGFDIGFYPSKGYLDTNDYNDLSGSGFTFHSYKYSLAGRLKKFFSGERSGVMVFP